MIDNGIPSITYPLVDKDGVEWRFEGNRPVSKIADDITHNTPEPVSAENLQHAKDLLMSGLFPDLSLKTVQ